MTEITGKLVEALERNAFSFKEEGEKFTNSWMSGHTPQISCCVYQGSASFKGNMARLLVKSSRNLFESLSRLEDEIVDRGTPFVMAISLFNDVLDACFGQDLKPDYKEKIASFMTEYRSLFLSRFISLSTMFQRFWIREWNKDTILV